MLLLTCDMQIPTFSGFLMCQSVPELPVAVIMIIPGEPILGIRFLLGG